MYLAKIIAPNDLVFINISPRYETIQTRFLFNKVRFGPFKATSVKISNVDVIEFVDEDVPRANVPV